MLLSQTNICTSAHNTRAALELVETDCSLNIIPLFHTYGLIELLLSSLASGASVVCTPGFYAPRFFEWVEEFCPTWYAAVPTMHQAILDRAAANREVIARCPLRFIRSGGSPLPPQTLKELERVFNIPLIEHYGMTEAASLIAINPLPPRERKISSVGVASGPSVAIMDEAGHLLPAGETGEIVIRGANVIRGYENNPVANQSAFINGWFRTGDQGFLDADGYLFITGRVKEIINRAGEKISPREVDEVLLRHPAVTQAATFAVPHAKLGEDVAAAVVLHENISVTEREIQEFAATRLADFKVPRHVVFVDEIPKGPTGKLQRIGLHEKLGLKVGPRPGSEKVELTAPRTPIEEKLAKIWSEVLGIKQVSIHDDFFQQGGDSILAAQIIAQIHKEMQVELSFITFFKNLTVAEMASTILELMNTESINQDAAHQLPTITPAPAQRHLPFPLSPIQQAYWVGRRGLFEFGQVSTHRYIEIECRDLDMELLNHTWQQLIERHEMLRAIVRPDGQQQVLAHVPPYEIKILDLRGCDPQEMVSQIESVRQRMADQVLPADQPYAV